MRHLQHSFLGTVSTVKLSLAGAGLGGAGEGFSNFRSFSARNKKPSVLWGCPLPIIILQMAGARLTLFTG